MLQSLYIGSVSQLYLQDNDGHFFKTFLGSIFILGLVSTVFVFDHSCFPKFCSRSVTSLKYLRWFTKINSNTVGWQDRHNYPVFLNKIAFCVLVLYERKYPLKTLNVQNCNKKGRGQRHCQHTSWMINTKLVFTFYTS